MNEYIGHICQMCNYKDYCYFGQGREIKTCVQLENQERRMDDICVCGGCMGDVGKFNNSVFQRGNERGLL